ERNSGNLAAAGAVSRLFSKRGVFVVPAAKASEDRLTELALEAGADDVKASGDAFELECDPAVFGAMRKALEDAKISPESAEISMVASLTVPLAGEAAQQMMQLVDALEEHDDVQNVYSNFEISDEDAAKLAGS